MTMKMQYNRREKSDAIQGYNIIAYQYAVDTITDIFNQYKSEEEGVLRETLFKKYREVGLDPDGKALRYAFDAKCTADGLHSIWRITNMEKDVEQIIPVYSVC